MARGWFMTTPVRPRRARRTAIPKAPARCVDCAATLVRTRGPGRAPLRCPACRERAKAAPKWVLAPGALERVRAHLGLEHPIHVRRSAGRHQHGSYRGLEFGRDVSRRLDPDRTYHVIQISSALTPELAARALVHEACHARQREQDPLVHWRAHRKIARHGSRHRTVEGYLAYRDHPTEREARAAEGAVHLLAPLTLPG